MRRKQQKHLEKKSQSELIAIIRELEDSCIDLQDKLRMLEEDSEDNYSYYTDEIADLQKQLDEKSLDSAICYRWYLALVDNRGTQGEKSDLQDLIKWLHANSR